MRGGGPRLAELDVTIINAAMINPAFARLQALAAEHKKDNTLTFEELGVDRLFVD